MAASAKFGATKKHEEEVVDFKKFNIEDLLLDNVSYSSFPRIPF